MLELIKKAYKEEVPTGYTLENIDKVVADFQELTLVHFKKYRGSHYNVNEYIIKAKKPLYNIEEKTFLDYVNHPLAMAITKFELNKKEEARLLVVSNNNVARYTIKEKNTNFSKAIIKLERQKNKEALNKIKTKDLISDKIRNFIGEKK